VALRPPALAEPLQQIDRVHVLHRGRKLVYFGGCDYYRMSLNPHVRQALEQALAKDGLNVAASRVTTGNHFIYEKLETALRGFFKVEEALLAPTGYTASLIIAQALAGEFSHVLIDEGAHPSLRDASRFLGGEVIDYKHRDAAHVSRVVSRCGKSGTIALLTDGVFSSDGQLAPLPELLAALPGSGVLLLDDAHGAGVLGKNGRGTAEHFGVRDKRMVRAITLSKAFGAFGGAVLGSRDVCRKIVARSGLFAGSTPPPLPLASAALAALTTVAGDDGLRARLKKNTALIGREFPILSIAPRTKAEALRLKHELLKTNIFSNLIYYPGGPKTGYFRFAISSEHTREQIEQLLSVARRYQ
jgi:8-amino-7-oxononanoate synthase